MNISFKVFAIIAGSVITNILLVKILQLSRVGERTSHLGPRLMNTRKATWERGRSLGRQ